MSFEIEKDFVFVEGGKFLMGSPADEFNRFDDETQHEVVLSGFYMAKTPVTQKQWCEIMGNNPARRIT